MTGSDSHFSSFPKHGQYKQEREYGKKTNVNLQCSSNNNQQIYRSNNSSKKIVLTRTTDKKTLSSILKSFLLLSPACSSRSKDSSPAAIAWNRNGNINSNSNIGIVHAVWAWVHTPVRAVWSSHTQESSIGLRLCGRCSHVLTDSFAVCVCV